MKAITDYQDEEIDPMIPPFGGKVQDKPYFPAQEEEDLPTDISNDIEPMLPVEQQFQPDRQILPDDENEDVQPMIPPNR